MSGRRGWRLAQRLAELEQDAHLPVDAVVAFVDGELGPAAHHRAAGHMRQCSSCAAEIEAQRRTRGALRAAVEPVAPAGLLASLQSIPQTVPLPQVLEDVAVARDGTVVRPINE